MKNKIIIRIISIVLLVITMIAIYMFSEQESVKSNNLSDTVGEVIHAPQETNQNGEPYYVLISGIHIHLRKYAHMFLFALMGLFSYFSIPSFKFRPLIAFGISYTYACLDEFHQSFTGRTALFTDTLYDGFGAIVAILICTLVVWLIKKKNQKKN